jgi:hypothetical protein
MDSNPSNISVVLFLKNLSSEIAPNSYIVPLSVLLIGLLFYSYWLWKRSIKSENDRLVQICWWILILLLWVPRLKPYSMLIAGIALVPILQRKSRAWAVGLLVLSIFHRVINGDKKNHLWYLVANNTAVYAFMLILFFAAIAKSKKTENNF